MNIAHLANPKEYTNHYDIYRVKDSGGLDINYVNLTAFLHDRGFYLFRQSVTRHIYIRIVNNIVKEVGKVDIKREILNYVYSNGQQSIHEFFIKSIAKATSDDFLETLEEKVIKFRKDQKEYIELYFQNCIVRINKFGITTHPYTELVGYIWESQIIPRDYAEQEEGINCDFKTFCWNISSQNIDRYKSLCSAIGFLIHNYKNPAYCPAIILNDEVISDNPEGGTGKGLFIKGIQQYMRTVTVEGKTFTFDKNFVYQRVNADTKILCFQDVNKNFDFERLFSVLTDGIEIEKKGIGSTMIEFDDSPKIVITTNYAIRGEGNSHERRRFELEISQYYNGKRTPFDEFKRMMFIDWDSNEWQKFDGFIAYCCIHYLKNGLIKQELIHLPEKRLASETNSDFLEFMEGFDFSMTPKSELYENFLKEYPEYHKHKWYSKQKMTSWIGSFARFHGYRVEDHIYNSIRHYKFEPLQTL